VSAEEGIVNTDLVELYEDFVSWRPVKSRDISAAEHYTSKTKRHELVVGLRHISLKRVVITGPHGAIALTSEEMGSSQHKWPLVKVITFQKSSES